MASADGVVLSPNILSHVRKDNDKLIVFLCNMGGTPYKGILKVEDGVSCMKADPSTGEYSDCESSTADGKLVTSIEIKAYEGCFYIVNIK
jgi:hypothetical protein